MVGMDHSTMDATSVVPTVGPSVVPSMDSPVEPVADGPRSSGGSRFGVQRLFPPGRSGKGATEAAQTAGDDRESFDLRNAWQVVAGSILIPLGLIFILLAWYGAAHARVVQQQIPYLVSGAFVGLGCMVVGGMLYWGHWLYRLYDQKELHHEEELRLLRELVQAMAASSGGGVAGSQGGMGSTVLSTHAHVTATGGAFLATAVGSVYHLADCPVIAHHADDAQAVDPARMARLRPCQICLPRS